MNGLIGRRARGPDASASPAAAGNAIDGEIVVAEVDGDYLRIWILDAKGNLRRLLTNQTIVLPRDAEEPLR